MTCVLVDPDRVEVDGIAPVASTDVVGPHIEAAWGDHPLSDQPGPRCVLSPNRLLLTLVKFSMFGTRYIAVHAR